MKRKQIKATVGVLLTSMLAPLAMAVPANAATRGWIGWKEGSDTLWSSAENWYLDQIPVDNDDVQFSTSAHYHEVDLDSDFTANTISFLGDVDTTSSKSFRIFSTADHTLSLVQSIEAVMTGTAGDHAIETNVSLTADATFSTSGSNTLSIGDTDKTLALGANNLTLDASGGTISILGEITGSGAITNSGTGNVEMRAVPGTGGFTGSVALTAGTMSIVENTGVNVTVSGGTLKGTGTAGTVTMSSGTVAPGNSPGTLNTGNLTFTGGTHAVELGGKAAGEFDKLNVTGTVDLGSATVLDVSLVNSFKPAVNDSFVIIENDGSDAITTTFKDKADGSSFTLGSYTYQINYDGGTGNDVVLLVTGASSGTPSTPDTGLGGILGNPITTIIAAASVIAMLAGHRVYEMKKVRK